MSDRPDTYLLYGSTDSGKTVELGDIAKWEHARTGMISRLVSADSGWDPIEELIVSPSNPQGIIEAWNIQSLQDPWVILIELSEGAWPKVVQDPRTGEFRVKMVRPTWKDGRILTGDGKRVGQYLIEGISTLASTGLQDHQRAARKLSQDVVGSFTSAVPEITGTTETMRSVTLSAAAPSHYGQVQRFLLEDLVPRFGRLAVDRVVWTGHEAKGRDEITGLENSVLGPATVGRAAVDRTTLKFGHTFHFTVETRMTKDPKGLEHVERDFRAWFVSHPDPTLKTMQWPAKVSLSKEQSKALLAKYPGGWISRNAEGMSGFLDFLHGPLDPPYPPEGEKGVVG